MTRVLRRRLCHEDPPAARVVSLVENDSQPEPQAGPGTVLTNRTTRTGPYCRQQRPHLPQVEPLCRCGNEPASSGQDDRPQKGHSQRNECVSGGSACAGSPMLSWCCDDAKLEPTRTGNDFRTMF